MKRNILSTASEHINRDIGMSGHNEPVVVIKKPSKGIFNMLIKNLEFYKPMQLLRLNYRV